MYSFEGDFRRKPQQSLRGASKKVSKEMADIEIKDIPRTNINIRRKNSMGVARKNK